MALHSAARAQIASDFQPPRAGCCLAGTAQSLADQLKDWNQLGRYHAANEELKRLPADAKRVVFMGDSITDGWPLAEAFPGRPYVNRGISGQTTAQMLVRMYPDVIALQPAAMILLAGTNDIAANNGPQTLDMIEQNVMAMVELAQVHHIKVILCALTPISGKQAEHRPPADILKLNAWLKAYAAKTRSAFVDYHAAVVDAQGEFRSGYSDDGLHPNARGYQSMKAAVSKALDEVAMSKQGAP
ncbi:MAG: SGNH/GDSL hydrolase family protein [Pseudomonadota bacterium]|nr:SGNH/GDSL hydrolase family protein [Pseudomonadota bacterium]